MTQDEYIDILKRQCKFSDRDFDIFVGVALKLQNESQHIILSSLSMREKSIIIARLKDRKNQLQLDFHTAKSNTPHHLTLVK